MAAYLFVVYVVSRPFGAAAQAGFGIGMQVVAVGEEYLRIVSWNFAASGVVFVASSMFQALGNTLPALMSSLARVILVAVPAFLLARLPGFHLRWIWYLTVRSVTLQMVLSLWLLRREFRIRLDGVPEPAARLPA